MYLFLGGNTRPAGKPIAVILLFLSFLVAGCGGGSTTSNNVQAQANINRAKAASTNGNVSSFNGTTIQINSQPPVVKTPALTPAQATSRTVDDSYCAQHSRTVIVIAHQDDDRYFFGGEIRKRIAAGNCIKVVHIVSGFSDTGTPTGGAEYNPNDPYYYQGRLDGSKATYDALLSQEFTIPVYETDAWDQVNGFTINRYIISTGMNGNTPSGQRIELQEFGVPSSSDGGPTSQAGVTVSQLYSDYTARTINLASLISNPTYGITNSYTWPDLQNMLNVIIGWANPAEILTLDPYGVPGDDLSEAQHPDHIMAARLVQQSAYASLYPNQVTYFKTYNVNNFQSNLASTIASASETDLNMHWQYDSGVSWITSTPCSNSMLDHASNGIQFLPYSWACKEYKATPNEYFVGRNIVSNSSGKPLCLNATSASSVTLGTCGATSLQVTLGQGSVAWVSNQSNNNIDSFNPNTYYPVLYPSSYAASAPIGIIDFSYARTDGTVRWHFNDVTSQLEFQFSDSSGNREILCLNANASGTAILSPCAGAITFQIANAALASTGNIKLQYSDSGNCLGISSSTAAIVSCTTSNANLIYNQNSNITDSTGTMCLRMPAFASTGSVSVQSCNSSSPGQKFAIEKIGNTGVSSIHPMQDQICLEGDLNFHQCSAFHPQQWIVVAR